MPRAGGLHTSTQHSTRGTGPFTHSGFAKITPNERQMVDREDETGSSPGFEELEVRPNLADSEKCGVVG